MSMSLNTRREITKMRELLWVLLPSKKCFFCKRLLMSDSDLEISLPGLRLGNATAPPMDLDITIHHVDEDHENNAPSNWALAHESCHRSHHAKKTFKLHRASVAGRRAA